MMECKYKVLKEDIHSFEPKFSSLCTRCHSEPPFPECDVGNCTYFKEKMEEKKEEELRKNPPPHPGYRRCPYMNNTVLDFECNIYLNNCSTCCFNPVVKAFKEQREKELAEQKRLKEESKLSYKIKKFFKKEN